MLITSALLELDTTILDHLPINCFDVSCWISIAGFYFVSVNSVLHNFAVYSVCSAGVLQYEQLSGVEGDSMQNSVLAVALHVFNEAEVPKKAAQQASSNQAANRQGAGGRDVPESSSVQYERSQPVSDALTTRAVAAQRRVKVPKLSQVWSHVDELASAAQTFEGNQTCRLVS